MKREPLTAREIDAATLASTLESRIEGDVAFDVAARAIYASDSSNYRQVPIGVVYPKTLADVVEIVAACREFEAPVLMRGAGTSLSGQTCNVAVVLDVSRYLTRIASVDPVTRTAIVEPGVVCDALRTQAEQFGLTFGPDPATHSRCTLGGMIGNNSCGAHSVMAGKTVENIEALEVLTYDGERMWVGPTPDDELERLIAGGGSKARIYAGLKNLRDQYALEVRERFPRIRRRVSGYNIDELLPESGFNVARALVGSEGTCAVVLQAKVKLVDSPPVRVLAVIGYEDIFVAGDRAMHVMAYGPIALEGLDLSIVEDLRKKNLLEDNLQMLPEGRGWLLAEIGASTMLDAEEKARRLIDAELHSKFARSACLYVRQDEQKKVWAVREVGAGAGNAVPGAVEEPSAGWEDAAVDPARLGEYLREYSLLLQKYGYRSSLYGHFGDGCVHGRVTFRLRDRKGLNEMRSFMQEATDLVVKYGGSISGEHGDGQARAEFLPRMYGPQVMQAFREFKRIWDPQNRMNPGKLVDAYRVDENLRYGPEYRPVTLTTRFSFNSDFGKFSHAAERCVGVAKCRNTNGGVMCPSFRVTKDEKHSTRGRVRLLSELFRGESPESPWDSEEMKEALDLCFACKSCKNECPVQVDMATYKSEFLSHYYESRPRPMHAYAMGRIDRWARFASLAPRVTNFALRMPVVGRIAAAVCGLTRQRPIPEFAHRTFVRWFKSRVNGMRGRSKVILWPDTFNNNFHPQVAIAATRVLEAYGFEVILPPTSLCCGRPLYDFGMIDAARGQLARIMHALEPDIVAGTPIVALEPACASVFKDELVNLFPDDAIAQRLSRQVSYFSDFLHPLRPPRPPVSSLRAIVHGHCHHKAVLGFQSEIDFLRKVGIDAKPIEAGCCGMAGSIGFRPETYALSVRAAELELLPAVRESAADELIITSGFSCREQVAHLSDRKSMHVAEAVAMALDIGHAEALLV